MRLTLRTLLAWLDDMLPPEEVRPIAQQVAESDYAREIVDRIHRVSRQRRLTTPSSSGPEATDPNLVAEYLDDSLAPDQVVEFEKRCLTSDVHLAEVASVHQILSLLGNKARVPEEARHRMYLLASGSETLPVRPLKVEGTDHNDRVAAELPDWRPPAPSKRRPADLARPLAALAVLALLLGWSTWVNLRSAPRRRAEIDEGAAVARPPVPQNSSKVAPEPKPEAVAILEPNAKPVEVAQANEPAVRTDAEAAKDTEAANPPVAVAVEKKSAPAKAEAGVGAAAAPTVATSTGVMLRLSQADGTWERAEPGSAPAEPTDLVNLSPFVSTVKLGDLSLRFDQTARVHFEREGERQKPIRLLEGRMQLTSDNASRPVQLALGEASVDLVLPEAVPIGVERTADWKFGQAQYPDPGLKIYVPSGELSMTLAGRDETMTGPSIVHVAADGSVETKPVESMPDWVSGNAPSVVESELGRQFARFFRATDPPLQNLVEAAVSDQNDMRTLAMNALASLSQFSVIVEAFNAKDQPEARHAAISAMRKTLARGEPSVSLLRAELMRYGEKPEWLQRVEALLVGPSAEDARKPEVRTQLTRLLEHADVGVRELALDNLRQVLSRGDSLGYDPDKPNPEAVKAWRDLLDDGER